MKIPAIKNKNNDLDVWPRWSGALSFSFSPASPQHKEASAEERGVLFVDEKVELAPVVQKLDSAIHRINHCPVDKY